MVPFSCSAQKNTLTRISSAERSDGQGHVIRFHLDEKITSFNFSQPQAYLAQLQLKGSKIDSTNIRLQDESEIITGIDYYKIKGGLGVDLFFRKGTFYKAAAYPDRNRPDILLGLTKATSKQLAQHIKSMQQFPWSDAPATDSPLVSNTEPKSTEAKIDTTYQKIKDKLKFDVVVLDAGHGGHDVGTSHNGIYEKDIVLDITKKVGNYIKENIPDVEVVYTRETDKFIELEQRGSIANRAEGDLFVSIHANAAPAAPRARGTETYFLGLERTGSALEVMKRENTIVSENSGSTRKKLSQEELLVYELANSGYIANSEKLAGMLQHQFKNRAQRKSRGVKQARFVVLYHASMPAVLIETGFITNPSEAQYLRSDYGQSIIASAIFRAIRNYKQEFEKGQHLTDQQ